MLTAKELAESLCCDAPASQRSIESVIQQVMDELADDPQWDATDSAHPAWWRGNDAGANAVAAIALNAAHGMKHSGVYGSDLIERMAKEIESLLAIARELAEHLIADKGLSCKVCYPNESGVAVGHKRGCPVARLGEFK